MEVSTSLVLRSQPGPLDHLVDAAVVAMDACDFPRTIQLCLASLPWAQACGDRVTVRYLRYVGALALADVAELDRAEDLLAELLAELSADDDDPLWRAKALAQSARLSLEGGRPGQAVQQLVEVEDLLASVGADAPTTMNGLSARMATALVLQAAGAFDEAERRLRGVLDRVTDVPGLRDLNVLPELVLLLVERAARERLRGGAAADRDWVRVLSLTRRWRRCGEVAGEPGQVARAVACEALAFQAVGLHDAAAAAVGDLDLFTAALSGRREETVGRLYLAGQALHRGDHARAREHLAVALEQCSRTAPGVWTFTVLAAQAAVDVAEHGPHPAADRWRDVARALLARTSATGHSVVSEVEARQQARHADRRVDAAARALTVDALTGAVNRRGLDDALAAATLAGRPVTACFVDLDRFKAVNDDFSHEVGDAVLRRVVAAVRSVCRAGDLVARYGGDEFVVLVADGVDPRDLAARVLDAVAEHPWHQVAPGLAVTVSVGVADELDAAAVLAAADAAMLDAKRAGRSRVVSSPR